MQRLAPQQRVQQHLRMFQVHNNDLHAQQPTRLDANFDPVRAFYPNFIEAAVAKHFPALFVCFVTNINVNWVATARKVVNYLVLPW